MSTVAREKANAGINTVRTLAHTKPPPPLPQQQHHHKQQNNNNSNIINNNNKINNKLFWKVQL
jgi:hypothetical protein